MNSKKVIEKVLIANRGEVAVRIIQAAHLLNIKTVLIYTQTDKNTLAVKYADETICIGSGEAKESYLNIEEILCIAKNMNCDAIHPGYGMLSENLEFRRECEKENIDFIGPTLANFEKLQNKFHTKKIAMECGVETIPGCVELIKSENDLQQGIKELSFPIVIKANSGGGGKGVLICENREEVVNLFNSAVLESQAAFGDHILYLEELIETYSHIEVQVLGDKNGNQIVLGCRDCTTQFKNQKVIEETVANKISKAQKQEVQEKALQIIKKVNYVGAGTVEFLYDHKVEKFYFMEINKRLQVEHGISEMTSGIDIVKAQFLIEQGESVFALHTDFAPRKYAIECRVCALDCRDNVIKPSCGVIKEIDYPFGIPNLRIESGIRRGGEVSPYYDSLLVKLILSGESRKSVTKQMIEAVQCLNITGIETNQSIIIRLLKSKEFSNERYDNHNFENVIEYQAKYTS